MWRKRWVQILLILVVLLLGGLGWVFYAVKQVRPFYLAARAIPEDRLKEGNREFLNRASRFKNDLRKPGEWSLLITDEQINGWLAVDLANNHPDFLPEEIQHPRIKIEPQQISLGVMVERDPFPVAASIDFSVQVDNRRELAMRVIAARAGTLPWPVDTVMAMLRRAATNQGWTVRETTIDNDPVLMLSPPPPEDGKAEVILETIDLREGEIFLKGKTMLK